MAQKREMQTCVCGYQHDWRPTFAKHQKECELLARMREAEKFTERKVKAGEMVVIASSATTYSTGGNINSRFHNRPVRLLKFNDNGKHALLDRPVSGWVPVQHLYPSA